VAFSLSTVSQALWHIDAQWPKLSRYHPHDDGSLIGLPHPYVVPSLGGEDGFHFEEQYYWDSFFIAQGLYDTKHEAMVRHMTENLFHLLERFGMIPNANRYFHTSHSQPPLLTSLIWQLYERDQDGAAFLRGIRLAQDEYRRVWMGTKHPNWHRVHQGLSRYYDVNVLHALAELESGWDMTSRFHRRCLDYLPIDLNCLLYVYERDFERAAELLGEAGEAAEWRERAEARRTAVSELLWDEEAGFYFDFNYVTGKRGSVYSLAAYTALWSGLASEEQAVRLVDALPRFERVGGLATTEKDPGLSQLVPEQWSSPNGWAPLHWFVTRGLERYGYMDESRRIKERWLHTNLAWFCKRGEFIEKYNVDHPDRAPKEGVYPNQTGFGWTNAVFIVFARELFGPHLHHEAPERLGRDEILRLAAV
jgi:alpha,alpha-trehalase